MPNGTDCSNLLQTEALCVPTQWVILDCTPEAVARPWLRKDVGDSIDFIELPRAELEPGASAEAIKRALIAARPKVTGALLDAFERRKREGTHGRLVIWVIADLDDPLGRAALVELPLDLANLMFWKTGNVPGVIRGCFGGGGGARGQTLADIAPQYFKMADFSGPYYGRVEPGGIYANEFDSVLAAGDPDAIRRVVEHLVPLHISERNAARSRGAQLPSAGGVFVIEEAMAGSLAWRKIDWLAVSMYPYFARLWDADATDILDVLDFTRCPQRSKDPWAALKQRKREKSWDTLSLPDSRSDLALNEGPYRISPGDTRARLELARFLLRSNLAEELQLQIEAAKREARELPRDWMKLEGLLLHRMGKEGALDVLGAYRTALEAEPSPSAEMLDEIAGIALMERDFPLARRYALLAIEKDKGLLHAYDGLVIAGRMAREPSYEREARELAAKNGVRIPLLVREETAAIMKTAQPVEVPAKKWWQFWK